MKIILKTDFIDYYDHHFDILLGPEPHLVFKRMSRKEHRKDAFEYLTNSLDELVVPHGSVSFLYSVYGPENEIVVYTDPYAHAGIGKEKMSLQLAYELHPEAEASLFLKHDYTIRKLVIGHKVALLRYTSDHPWKTNVGDVVILPNYSIFDEAEYNKDFPLFAVDYAGDNTNGWYAIDLNTSPLIKFSPVEKDLKPKEVADEIRGWMEWKYVQ